MLPANRSPFLFPPLAAMILVSVAPLYSQSDSAPNPYRTVGNWARLPEGRIWGATSAVEIDPDGKSIWVAERCGANNCAGSELPVVLKFDASGKLVKSFGAGLFIFPHGIDVDHEGNVWVTDTIPTGAAGRQAPPGMGHRVIKFSAEGEILLILGKAGVTGDGPDTFNQPSDVVVAPSGDIFVADGHGGETNARIVHFSGDGKFIKAWGKKGNAPGDLDTPHAIAIDSQGRLFVGDRANNRIQIFNQEGKLLDQWTQFGRPSGIYIDKNDRIYVADSESNTARNPGWKRGIRVGSAKDGSITAFIPDPEPNPDRSATSGAEGVAADAAGNIYGAEVGPRGLKRYEPQ
jgi:sugar lactone lactonase YvrE